MKIKIRDIEGNPNEIAEFFAQQFKQIGDTKLFEYSTNNPKLFFNEYSVEISCPNPSCNWKPEHESIWHCDVCRSEWNVFYTNGSCPGCPKVHVDVRCPECRKIAHIRSWYKHTFRY